MCSSDLQSEWVIPASLQSRTPQTSTFNVTDHFMEPYFLRDETVLVDLSARTPEIKGVYVISDLFTPMIRYCEITQDNNVRVSAEDKGFQPQNIGLGAFEILGRVIG